jgi:CheY-like chemotaxis protein/DNA-binding XRE family transcriptional regulator
MSQEELAERADLHRTYVSDVERGARNVSLQSIQKLARALEISVSALFPQLGPQTRQSLRSVRETNDAADFVDILLVEDNTDDVELTLRAFQQARFTNRIEVVKDGAAALDFLFYRGKFAHRRLEARSQIVLLDLDLPRVGGLEVLRRIKADHRTRPIPVVILTDSQSTHDIAECRRLGAETYISKPVNFQRLSQATPHLALNWALLKPSESLVHVVQK